MEFVRRIIIVGIWGFVAYLVFLSLGAWKHLDPGDTDRIINEAIPFYVIVIGGAFAVHFIINWIFGGAKKKTPDDRSHREPDL